MSGAVLTIPPPRDDDHDDVAWALRAAAAQWRRSARDDAIGWIQRAADTAVEIGQIDRAKELTQLSRTLTGGPIRAVAPPLPLGALSISSANSDVDVEIDLDANDDDIEMLDDLDDLDDIEEVEELQALEEAEDLEEDDALEELEELQPGIIEEDLTNFDPRGAPTSRALLDSVVDGVGPLGDEEIDHTLSEFGEAEPEPEPPQLVFGRKYARDFDFEEEDEEEDEDDDDRDEDENDRDEEEDDDDADEGDDREDADAGSEEELAAPESVSRDQGPQSGAEIILESREHLLRPSVPVPPSPSRAPSIPDLEPSPSGFPSRPWVPSVPELEAPRRSSTSQSRPSAMMDLPPSMRPDPSGIDLEEAYDAEAEFGELDFGSEHPTDLVSIAPPPDLGDIPNASHNLSVDHSTVAEYATAKARGPSAAEHEELERELGVDLSVRERGGIPSGHGFFESGAKSSEAESLRREPVIGRASLRASSIPGVPRQSSAEREPYPLAPSADMPPAQEFWPRPPPIEPPSHPRSAPPPESMSEPEERPSILPEVNSPIPPSFVEPALSSAPSAEELDEMFDAISRPPPLPPAGIDVPQWSPISAPPPPGFGHQTQVSSPPPGFVPRVDGVDFVSIVGFQDLTDEAAYALVTGVKIVSLAPGELLGPFGVAIVTSGALSLAPETVDASFATLKRGEVLYCEGTLGTRLIPRAIAALPETRVAIFSIEALNTATTESPWVADELSEIGDRYQALAGAMMGKLGSAMDDMFRPMVLEKCNVRVKSAGDIIAKAGQAMDGLYILGVGSLEILALDGAVKGSFQVGDIIFPETILSASAAESTVRVAPGGALLLYAARMSAHELLATCPPFIEILAGY